MAKNYTGVRIRIGAAHDDVTAFLNGNEIAYWDRNEMRKTGNAKMQGELRRSVVDLYNEKERRSQARLRDQQRKAARRNKRQTREEATA